MKKLILFFAILSIVVCSSCSVGKKLQIKKTNFYSLDIEKDEKAKKITVKKDKKQKGYYNVTISFEGGRTFSESMPSGFVFGEKDRENVFFFIFYSNISCILGAENGPQTDEIIYVRPQAKDGPENWQIKAYRFINKILEK